jgi:hypothetical protein
MHDENATTTTVPTLTEFLDEWAFLLTEPGAPARDDITGVDAYWCTRGDLSETNVAALLTLTGDRWAALVSWCDTTGYGCQNGTDWKVCATREEAISQGLDKDARGRLGVALPGETAEVAW